MRRTVMIALAGAAFLAAAPAQAQQFPADSEWTPLRCGDLFMHDRHRDEPGALDERDLVGDQNRPAGLRAVDDDYLYLRLRLDADPAPEGAVQPFAWGLAVDLDGDLTTYELLIMADGIDGEAGIVAVYTNQTTTLPNDPNDPADTPPVATYAFADNARSVVASGSSFGNGPDYFLDLAVPWADLTPLGLAPETPVRVVAGSSSTRTSLDGDLACHDGGGGRPGLDDVGSDPVVLDPEVDSDGDGYSDDEEVRGGSDPHDPNSVPGGGGRLEGGGGCAVAAAAAPRAWLIVLILLGPALALRPRGRAA